MSAAEASALPGHLCLRRGYRLQWEARQQGWVMLYPEGMVRLNESAGAILELCRAPVRVDELLEALRERFPGQDIDQDVMEFLRDAYDQRWLDAC